MRVLVTGAGGFVGPHLRRALQAAGAEVLGLGLHLHEGGIDIVADVTDATATAAAVAKVKPDAVVHLAGLSSVAECSKDPMRAFQINASGALSVVQAVLAAKSPCRVLLVSSGEVYGAAAGTGPMNEQVLPDPMNVYGATKRAGEIIALQHRHQGLDVMIARPFNHIGPGQTPTFVLPSFAQQLAAVHRGGKVTLEVGNLSAVRDFSHVQDIVDSYVLMLSKGKAGEIYNLGSGVGRTIESMLQLLVAQSGREVTVKVDPKRLRPVEIPTLIGDVQKLKALGWAPSRTVESALGEILEEMESRAR
ncbi:MAG: GDP-mannose 4,6-dehydratase [Archangium sp.]|nr:GDP-mannose 4,6-dehydratase [Archangium sp.]MDP3151033.1 GDP-mannose 4,6-dehydratase [Archangium sp.]MDP3569794.1 GDP-mannose 4,6-dehydratase [Archangium sp.]